MNFQEKLRNKFFENDIVCDDKCLEQFEKYYNLLLEWNGKFNLTAITDEDEVIEKHFLDSVLPYKNLPEGARVVDIGAGAGFPSIPLKILRKDLSITLVDSVDKKVRFLSEVIRVLDLKNASALHERAEDLAQKKEFRENFDVCVARAVAGLNTLSEYCLPFVKLGGKFFAFKSENLDEEIENGKKAILCCGGEIREILDFSVGYGIRKILVVEKIKQTPKQFPRGKNKPRLLPIN